MYEKAYRFKGLQQYYFLMGNSKNNQYSIYGCITISHNGFKTNHSLEHLNYNGTVLFSDLLISGGQRTFIEAFFVTFNLVANLTMAEMPNDLSSSLTLVYILIFVIFGMIFFSSSFQHYIIIYNI